MRILHTADWHLGRVLHQVSLLEDQAELLEQVFLLIQRYAPDALIIAGDVFDRANPRKEAIALFDQFLSRVYRETSAAIVVIAGNHDAPERIGYGGALHDPKRVLIRGPLDSGTTSLVLNDGAGPVAISALPETAAALSAGIEAYFVLGRVAVFGPRLSLDGTAHPTAVGRHPPP